MAAEPIPAVFRTPNGVWELQVPPPAPEMMTFRGERFRKVGHFWIERGTLAVAYTQEEGA